MNRWWCIVVLLMTMSMLSHTQDRAMFRLGPAFGYRAYDLAISASTDGVVRTTDPGTILGEFLGVTTSIAIPLGAGYSLRGDLAWQRCMASPGTDRIVPFAVNGRIVDGTIRSSHTVAAQFVSMDAGVEWSIHPMLQLGAVAGIAAFGQATTTWEETITSPTGVTFVSTGTSTRGIPNATIIGAALTPSFFVGADASTSIAIGQALQIRPAVQARYHLTPALRGTTWQPWDIGMHLQVAMPLTPITRPMPAMPVPESTAARRIEVRRSLSIDTVTIVDRYHHARRDTLHTIITTLDSTLEKGASVDLLHIRERRRVERHLPGPAPFLGVILDARVDVAMVDTLASVVWHVDVESDTSTLIRIDVLIDSMPTWSTSVSGRVSDDHVQLRNIVPDITTRERMHIEVRATATDAHGQTRSATPMTFTVRRVNGTRRLR